MDERTCGAIAELVSAFRDNEVTPEERTLVQTHLDSCLSCSARLASYDRLHEGLKQYLASIPVPPLEQPQGARRNRERTKAGTTVPEIGRSMIPRIGVVSLAVIAVVALALIGVSYVGSRTQPARAQEIVDKAAKVADDPAASGIRSIEVIRTSWSKRVVPRFGGVGTEMRSESRIWWQAPNLWRTEFQQTAPVDEAMAEPNVSVSDGQSVWNAIGGKQVTINAWDSQMDIARSLSPFGGAQDDLASLLKSARQCYDPRVLREENVAGRSSYVIDLGPSKCPSASALEMNGRRIIWVDKETFFELKSEQYGTEPDQGLAAATEVTTLRYNVPIDPKLFTFTPPAGAIVQDYRPKPAPSTDEFQQQLEQVAFQIDFPLFAPKYVPPGLMPRQPRLDPVLGTKLAYVPSDEVDKSSLASRNGIEITEQRATNDLVERWTGRAETVDIAGAKGWLRRGVRNVDGTGSDSAALVLRDGTLVSVKSFTISPEELLKVAASLQPAPGSKPPLPNPASQSFAEIRGNASFKVFAPTYLPSELRAEPPVSTQQQGSDRNASVLIKFHTPDGALALRLSQWSADQPEVVSPLQNAPEVAIDGNRTGRLYETSAPRPSGTRLLWWIQDGTRLSLETQVLSKDELLRVAASMSPTADLGLVETPTSRPTPSPVPAPKFAILRPTWLPEKMEVREQYEAGPPELGSSVVFGFDPRPEDKQPHSVLMLREMPKAMAGSGGRPDPQESHETIGGRDVTIIRRGDSCITLSWEQDDILLRLTNPYDPPGHPRYSCDELLKVVESIR